MVVVFISQGVNLIEERILLPNAKGKSSVEDTLLGHSHCAIELCTKVIRCDRNRVYSGRASAQKCS